jgi:hypothetical protein
MKHHRIITQTAGNDPNVLDCTPPLIVTEREIDYFIAALDQVLESCKHGLGPVWEMGTELMKRSMEQGVALPSLQHGPVSFQRGAALGRS